MQFGIFSVEKQENITELLIVLKCNLWVLIKFDTNEEILKNNYNFQKQVKKEIVVSLRFQDCAFSFSTQMVMCKLVHTLRLIQCTSRFFF